MEQERERERPGLGPQGTGFSMSTSRVSPPATKRLRETPHACFTDTLPSRPITALNASQIRVFTWNVNGILPFLQTPITTFFKAKVSASGAETSLGPASERSLSLRERLRHWQWPHVVCLQEVKIAPGDDRTQGSVRRAVKSPAGSNEPSYNAFFSLPRDRYNARAFGGKVYGVCTIVRTDLLSENVPDRDCDAVSAADWDLEGRILRMELPRLKLLLVNVYAVNGTDNMYRNTRTGEEEGTRHDFKRRFHTKLKDMIVGYRNKGWSAVIAGDLNIARSIDDGFPGIRLGASHVENRHDFDMKFMRPFEEGGLGMIDSFRHLHGSERKYTYRSPGVPWGTSCDRVDMILLSPDMEERQLILTEADILDQEDERGTSDHLPSYVTLDIGRLK